MEILAIIPARGGSKGIKNKNIRLFAGKPLIAHAIAQAKRSRHISRIIVSTDSPQIATVAKRYKAEVPFLRPASLAGDKSPIVPAIVHLLEKLKADEKYQPDYIVLLQPTSPLRTADDIDGALETLFKAKAKAIVSVCATEQLVFTLDKKQTLRLVSSKSFLASSNRQALPATYRLDGSMVYALATKTFLTKKTFLPTGVLGYVIPAWRAVDLDEPQDFVVGELIYKQQKTLSKKIKYFK